MDGQVKMAHLAIVAGYLCKWCCKTSYRDPENQELKDFYEMMPEKFNNKTNGITQRRFLLHGNPLLADWITRPHRAGLDHRSSQLIHKLKVYAG